MNTSEAKKVLETALLCAQEPLAVLELRRLFDDELNADTVRRLLEELRLDWNDRGLELDRDAATEAGCHSGLHGPEAECRSALQEPGKIVFVYRKIPAATAASASEHLTFHKLAS